MTHVSKRPLKQKTSQKIQDNLLRAVFSGRTAKRQAVLLTLLTPTEKIMLAKRLAIIIMLSNDFSYYRISKTLKVSTSTLIRFHRQLLAGSYRPIQKMIGRSASTVVVDFLEKLLQMRMPPMAGPGRWKFLNEHRY